MLALIVDQPDRYRSQALSSRQRAPPAVYPQYSKYRESTQVPMGNGAAALQVGKSRVKGGVAVFDRRPWVGARQGRRQREDRLRRRVDVERHCTWGAVEWTWDVVVLGRRR